MTCPKCGLVWEHGCPECMFIRIRELEVELAGRRKTSDYNYDFQELKARAEKAEAARDSWRNQAKVQEARVAELLLCREREEGK